MSALTALIGILALGQTPALEPEHEANPVYHALLDGKLQLGGQSVAFPLPVIRDGLSSDEQRQELVQETGSEGRLKDLLRDSVTAPFILKVRDIEREGETLIRAADVWFVVHANLDEIDPEKTAREAASGEPVEAGNMRFASRLIDPEVLEKRKIAPTPGKEWYAHLKGRLLDRIAVEATDRVYVSRSTGSLVVAAQTSDAFTDDTDYPNRWASIEREDGKEVEGQAYPYDGGGGYVKISKLAIEPGALLVEAHFAFAEPRPWFDGAPILRSKFSLIAQDQIRSLRRELARRHEEP